MLASYALELHALKAELQSTLARLGVDTVRLDDGAASSDRLDASSAAEAAATTATRPSARHFRRSDRRRPVTRWNRRQLTQELAAASHRRRELERQLQRQMERQGGDAQRPWEQLEPSGGRRTAWQAAITELQLQRAEIRRQMEQEAAPDAAAVDERGDVAQVRDVPETESRQDQVPPPPPPPPTATRPLVAVGSEESMSETQYSIGGVVTLEPLSSTQREQVAGVASSRTGVSFRPVAAAASVLDAYPRCRNTPDALNDVFSLQVKFAETMLKLEKSVQMRDQLLHRGTTSLPKRRAGTQTEGGQVRRRAGHQLPRRKRAESGSNSDSSVMVYRESHSSESFSSSAYSFSSLDSTPHHGQAIRVRYPNFGVSRATTAETLAPSSSGANNSPSPVTTVGEAPVSSSTTTTLSPHDSPSTIDDTGRHIDAERPPSGEPALEQQDENHRTPTTGSSVTTPTTGSDQKSNTSASKQVRFGEDAYSTPVLARKFNFDGPSIDEDDYEEKEEEAASVLSFLGGSSISSAELNDASFLRAFERFRRELQVSKHDSAMQSPPLARKLFLPRSAAFPTSNPKEGWNSAESIAKADKDDHLTVFPELGGLNVDELQGRRRQLCLDIQAESAQLVLNFGAMQSVAAGSQTKNRLMALRDELQAVDARVRALQ